MRFFTAPRSLEAPRCAFSLRSKTILEIPIAWYKAWIPGFPGKSIREGETSSLFGRGPESPKIVWVALEQETFLGLSGPCPKRVLAPSLIGFRGNSGVRPCTRQSGPQRIHIAELVYFLSSLKAQTAKTFIDLHKKWFPPIPEKVRKKSENRTLCALFYAKKSGFEHFFALFLESAETPLFVQINVLAVWTLMLDRKYTSSAIPCDASRLRWKVGSERRHAILVHFGWVRGHSGTLALKSRKSPSARPAIVY